MAIKRILYTLFLTFSVTLLALFASCGDTSGTCDPEAEEDGVCVCFDETDTECEYADEGCDTCFFPEELESDAAGETQTLSVTLRNYAFSSKNVGAPVGTRITWTNAGPDEHILYCDHQGISIDEVLRKGDSFSYTFVTPGNYVVRDRLNQSPKLQQNIIISP